MICFSAKCYIIDLEGTCTAYNICDPNILSINIIVRWLVLVKRRIRIFCTAGILLCVLYFTGPFVHTAIKDGRDFDNKGNPSEKIKEEDKTSIDEGKQDIVEDSEKYPDLDVVIQDNSAFKTDYINQEGMTVMERYLLPEGYKRVEVEESSFGEFLRKQRLKPYGEKALYYDGREKPSKGKYDSVFDVDIGDRDLHLRQTLIRISENTWIW